VDVRNEMTADPKSLAAKLKFTRKLLKQAQAQKHQFYCAFQDTKNLVEKMMDFVTPRCKNVAHILNLIRRLHTTDKMKSAQILGKKHEDQLREQKILYKKLIRENQNLHAQAIKIMNEHSRTSLRGMAAENVALRSKVALLEHKLNKQHAKI